MSFKDELFSINKKFDNYNPVMGFMVWLVDNPPPKSRRDDTLQTDSKSIVPAGLGGVYTSVSAG